MDFDISPRARELSLRLEAFIEKYVLPYNAAWHLSVLEGHYPPVFFRRPKNARQRRGAVELLYAQLRGGGRRQGTC